jgi:hypothetical protein
MAARVRARPADAAVVGWDGERPSYNSWWTRGREDATLSSEGDAGSHLQPSRS